VSNATRLLKPEEQVVDQLEAMESLVNKMAAMGYADSHRLQPLEFKVAFIVYIE
jgi:hypothetical protein